MGQWSLARVWVLYSLREPRSELCEPITVSPLAPNLGLFQHVGGHLFAFFFQCLSLF